MFCFLNYFTLQILTVNFAKVTQPYPEEPSREAVVRWGSRTTDILAKLHESVPKCGIELLPWVQLYREDRPIPWWSSATRGFRVGFYGNEHAHLMEEFPGTHSFQGFVADMPVYLRWLQALVVDRGARLVHYKAESLASVISLNQCQQAKVLFNCTALGSLALSEVHDENLYGLRGQTIELTRPPELNFGMEDAHFVGPNEEECVYIIPRHATCIVGGTFNVHCTSEVDEDATERILQRASKLVPSLRKSTVVKIHVGIRPKRHGGPRVELVENLLRIPVVHNYGHGGSGLTLSWGTALESSQLAQKFLPKASL